MTNHSSTIKQLIIVLSSLYVFLYSQWCHSFDDIEKRQDQVELSAKKCNLELGQYRHKTHHSECGQLEVPLDSANPNSKTILLNIVRIPSIKPLSRNPIFVLAGGPGQAATELASNFAYLFRDILQKHDLVFIDQRGTGDSNALNCDIETETLDALHPKQKQANLQKQYQACIANNPQPFAFYTTPYAVDDLEAVRKALGYTKVNLWGASYGTRVGLQYLRQYPDAIRTAVLDGLSPLEIALPKWTNRDSSQALHKVLSLCKSQPSCHSAYPNLLANWKNLLKQLKNQPIVLKLQHPRTQKIHSIYINDKTLSSWARFALYVRDWSPLLPFAMHKATQSDFQTLYSMAIQGSESMEDGISVLMHMAVICHEDALVKTSRETPEVQKNYLIHADTSQYDIVCPLFQAKAPLPERQAKNISSDAPVLLLSGELDPATPPIWGKYVSNKLTNSRHIIVPGGHHGVTALGCVNKIITTFIELGSLDGLNTNCISKIKPKAFFIDSAGPAMVNAMKNTSAKQVAK